MNKNPIQEYRLDIYKRALSYQKNKTLQKTWRAFHSELIKAKYPYNFFWLGVPIIQEPWDIQLMQEIIWEVEPDLIIETGIAWGGSIIFSASMLSLLETCNKIKNGKVVGIDVDIREHNKKNLINHPLGKKIIMIEGSSIDQETINKVFKLAKGKKKILVCLDSNHAHNHVLAELKAYTPLVSRGSYCLVGDTGVEDLPKEAIFNRPWGKGNNPKTAVREFLRNNKKFKIDRVLEFKIILTGAPEGHLRRIK